MKYVVEMSAFEQQQAAELADVDDWSSAWEECKRLGLKWGGRGRGGRATNRQTMQPRDVFVEGCFMISVWCDQLIV